MYFLLLLSICVYMQFVLQSALLCLIYLFISYIYFIHAVFVLFLVNCVIEKKKFSGDQFVSN